MCGVCSASPLRYHRGQLQEQLRLLPFGAPGLFVAAGSISSLPETRPSTRQEPNHDQTFTLTRTNTLHSPVLWDKQKKHIPNLRRAFQTSFTSNIQSMHVRSVHVRFVHVRSVHVRSVPVRSVHVGSVPVRLCMSDCDQGSLPPGQSLLSVVP